jgi:hypothetical protein
MSLYRATCHRFVAEFCTMEHLVSFLDQERKNRYGLVRVTAAEYAPVDGDDDGLSDLERECVNEPPGPVRDELVRRIDGAREVAA